MCVCVCVFTLSSALSRISLSGKAPSRGIHWSRTSCGSESRSLTGTTSDPIGWSHALDNYRDEDTFVTSVVGAEMFLRLAAGFINFNRVLWDTQYTHLHYEHFLHGVANRVEERLVPLRWSGAITHLQAEKEKGTSVGIGLYEAVSALMKIQLFFAQQVIEE